MATVQRDYGCVVGADSAPADPATASPDSGAGAAAGASARSMVSLDGHQFHRPSSTTVEGTSSVRTRKVSIRIPSASPSAMSRNWLPPAPPPATMPNTTKVPASTRPAEVTVVPVNPIALTTASRNGSLRASSLIRVMTRML